MLRSSFQKLSSGSMIPLTKTQELLRMSFSKYLTEVVDGVLITVFMFLLSFNFKPFQNTLSPERFHCNCQTVITAASINELRFA